MALFAAFLCIGVMFIANWWAALVTFVCIIIVYKYIDHRSLDVNWGSSGQAYTYTMVTIVFCIYKSNRKIVGDEI